MKDIFGQEYQYDKDKGFSNLAYDGGNPWDTLREPPKGEDDTAEPDNAESETAEPDNADPDKDSQKPTADVAPGKEPTLDTDQDVNDTDDPEPSPETDTDDSEPSHEADTKDKPDVVPSGVDSAAKSTEAQPSPRESFSDLYARLHKDKALGPVSPNPTDIPPSHVPEKLTTFSSLEELLSSIENPLDDAETLQDAVDAYSSYNNYYSAVQRSGTERKICQYINPEAHQQFEEDMFTRWRKNLESLTPEDIQREIDNGHSYFKHYASFKRVLERYKDRDIRTRKDLEDNLRMDFKDDQDKLDAWLDALDGYGFMYDENWKHIKSRYVNLRREENIDVKHRFYLNTDSIATEEMARELVHGFEDAKLPYYFKFDPYGDRRDTIVIYCSDDGAIDSLKVIQDVIKRRPDLAEHLREAPVLTGKIDGIIGYGPEPATTKDANGNEVNHSYTEVRAKVLEEAISDVSDAWFNEHWNDEYEINGVRMPISDHCDYALLEHTIEIRVRQYQNLVAKKSEADAQRICGFTLDEILPSGKYFKELESGIRSHRNGLDGERFEVEMGNRNKIYVSNYGYREARQSLVKEISRIDPDFNTKVRARIDEIARSRGIDPTNFCFDLPTTQSATV